MVHIINFIDNKSSIDYSINGVAVPSNKYIHILQSVSNDVNNPTHLTAPGIVYGFISIETVTGLYTIFLSTTAGQNILGTIQENANICLCLTDNGIYLKQRIHTHTSLLYRH